METSAGVFEKFQVGIRILLALEMVLIRFVSNLEKQNDRNSLYHVII